jgi:GNAT superfamily N-acetyltransferase
MEDDRPARDAIVIRSLRPEDHAAVVAIDAAVLGRRREEFFGLKLKQAFADTGIALSLAAELEGRVAGFLLARLYYGEFGVTERVAVLDVLDVHPDFRGRRVGSALLDQLRTNLLGVGVRTLQTEVAWDSGELVAFFRREGFVPAPRLCLDLDLEKTRT